MSKTKKMILSALLLALDIVLSRIISVPIGHIKFSFGFVPLMLAAIWLGPKYSILIAVLNDLIGALLFPVGEFFIGYTITALLDGAIYGFLLYKKPEEEWSKMKFALRVILSTLLVSVICNLFLSSLWSYIITEDAYLLILSVKLSLEVIRLPVKIVTILAITKVLEPITKKYLVEE